MNQARRRPRFNLKTPLPGRFGPADGVVLDISESGARLEHEERLTLGTAALLQFTDPRTGNAVLIRGVVIWSRLSSRFDTNGIHPYHSAIRFVPLEEAQHEAIARVVSSIGQFDSDWEEKKLRSERDRELRNRALFPYRHRSEIPADLMDIILKARQRLMFHPQEALKWYQRARFAQKDITEEEAQMQYRDEVFAVWEMLQRKVSVSVIALAFSGEE